MTRKPQPALAGDERVLQLRLVVMAGRVMVPRLDLGRPTRRDEDERGEKGEESRLEREAVHGNSRLSPSEPGV